MCCDRDGSAAVEALIARLTAAQACDFIDACPSSDLVRLAHDPFGSHVLEKALARGGGATGDGRAGTAAAAAGFSSAAGANSGGAGANADDPDEARRRGSAALLRLVDALLPEGDDDAVGRMSQCPRASHVLRRLAAVASGRPAAADGSGGGGANYRGRGGGSDAPSAWKVGAGGGVADAGGAGGGASRRPAPLPDVLASLAGRVAVAVARDPPAWLPELGLHPAGCLVACSLLSALEGDSDVLLVLLPCLLGASPFVAVDAASNAAPTLRPRGRLLDDLRPRHVARLADQPRGSRLLEAALRAASAAAQADASGVGKTRGEGPGAAGAGAALCDELWALTITGRRCALAKSDSGNFVLQASLALCRSARDAADAATELRAGLGEEGPAHSRGGGVGDDGDGDAPPALGGGRREEPWTGGLGGLLDRGRGGVVASLAAAVARFAEASSAPGPGLAESDGDAAGRALSAALRDWARGSRPRAAEAGIRSLAPCLLLLGLSDDPGALEGDSGGLPVDAVTLGLTAAGSRATAWTSHPSPSQLKRRRQRGAGGEGPSGRDGGGGHRPRLSALGCAVLACLCRLPYGSGGQPWIDSVNRLSARDVQTVADDRGGCRVLEAVWVHGRAPLKARFGGGPPGEGRENALSAPPGAMDGMRGRWARLATGSAAGGRAVVGVLAALDAAAAEAPARGGGGKGGEAVSSDALAERRVAIAAEVEVAAGRLGGTSWGAGVLAACRGRGGGGFGGGSGAQGGGRGGGRGRKGDAATLDAWLAEFGGRVGEGGDGDGDRDGDGGDAASGCAMGAAAAAVARALAGLPGPVDAPASAPATDPAGSAQRKKRGGNKRGRDGNDYDDDKEEGGGRMAPSGGDAHGKKRDRKEKKGRRDKKSRRKDD